MVRMLTPHEQEMLAGRVKQGDKRATERLLVAFTPLMKSLLARMAYPYRGTEEWQDLSAEMVIWTIELTKKWDPSVRQLDGYLKQFLTYKLLDYLKALWGYSAPGSEISEAVETGDDRARLPTVSIEEAAETIEDTSAIFSMDEVLSSETACQIISETRDKLDNDYLHQIFVLKLARCSNAEIATMLGVGERKIRNDWSRSVLEKIVRPILRKHGITIKRGVSS